MAKGKIAVGICAAHSPRIAFEERAGAVWHDLITAMHRAADALREHKPDVAVIVSAHWVTSFNIYVEASPRHKGVLTAMECPDLLRAIPYDFPGDPQLANAIVAEGKSAGLPVIGIDEPTYVEDYGTIICLKYLTPNWDLPIVSLPVCLMSTLDECNQLGAAVRAAVEKTGRRAAIISSSAFAHNLVRGPETWPKPEERAVDDHLIELMTQGRLDTARALLPTFAHQAQYEMGGRCIATLLGALADGWKGTLYGYGPSSGSGNPVIIFDRIGELAHA
jgi:3,4-dihydroxyphenylacetate 2,3-dioxygenase